jgi:hypothetical protein
MERGREYFGDLGLHEFLQIGVFVYLVLPQKYQLLPIPLHLELKKLFECDLGVFLPLGCWLRLMMAVAHDPFGEVLIVELEVNKLLYFVLID